MSIIPFKLCSLYIHQIHCLLTNQPACGQPLVTDGIYNMPSKHMYNIGEEVTLICEKERGTCLQEQPRKELPALPQERGHSQTWRAPVSLLWCWTFTLECSLVFYVFKPSHRRQGA